MKSPSLAPPLRRRWRSLYGSRWLSLRRSAVRWTNGGGHREAKGFNVGLDIVLDRFLDLHLVKVSRAFELGDEIGNGVDRSGFAADVNRISGARKRGKPESIHANHGVCHHRQQILASGAVPLEIFDHVDALLKDGLLAFETIHLILHLLKAGLLRLQLLNPR